MEKHPVILDARAQGYEGSVHDFDALADFLAARSTSAQVALALEQCVEVRPTSVGLRLRLGRLYREMANLALALPHFYHLYELDRNHRVGVEYLLWTAIECGRPDVASDVRKSYGDGRYEGLLKELQVRVQGEPENATLRFSLAWMLYREGKVAACRRAFQDLTKDPRWGIWSVISLGMCELEDQPQLAVDHFQRALRRLNDDPRGDYLEVFYHLAYAQLRSGHITAAMQNCVRLSQQEPNFPYLADLMEIIRKEAHGGRGGGPPGAPQLSPRTPKPPLGGLGHRRPYPPDELKE